MALCTRCGRQAESGAEFCSGCGGQPVPALAERPMAAPAMTAGAGYPPPAGQDWPGSSALPGRPQDRAGPGGQPLPVARVALDDWPGPGQPPAYARPEAGSEPGSRPLNRIPLRAAAEPGPHRPAGPPANGRWLSIAAAAVVLIMAAATVTILLAGHGKPAGRTATGRPASAPTPGRARPAATAPVVAGSPIAVAPAAARGPDVAMVVRFLTRYFTAINDHNYPAYRRLFSPALRGGLSAAAFRAGYGSTQDSAATLRTIAPAGTGQLAAAVTFTSHQQRADSPTHSACTAWSISLYLVRRGGQLVIESPPPGYAATSRSCS